MVFVTPKPQVVTMLHRRILFPNEQYREVLQKTAKYFEALPGVFAVILTGSLARGKAVEGSCIDLVFLEDYEGFFVRRAGRVRLCDVDGESRGEVCYFH